MVVLGVHSEMRMRIITLIPARAGSKRVLGKNIRNLGGKPLMVWSIETALQLGYPCFVSTDSEEFGQLATSSGAEVIIRPDKLASDDATDQDVIVHALQFISGREFDYTPSLLLYLRPTTPFRGISVIQRAISDFSSSPEFSCLRCVEELTESSFKTFTMEGKCLVPAFWRLMDANLPNHLYPPTYRNNGYMDIYRIPYDDSRVMGFVTERTLEIDTEEDLKYAEYILERRKP